MLNIISYKGFGKQTTKKYLFKPIRMMIIIYLNGKKTSVGANVEKLETLYTAYGKVPWCSYHGKIVWEVLKKPERFNHMTQQLPS